MKSLLTSLVAYVTYRRSSPSKPRGKQPVQLGVEALEDRRLMSGFGVFGTGGYYPYRPPVQSNPYAFQPGYFGQYSQPYSPPASITSILASAPQSGFGY